MTAEIIFASNKLGVINDDQLQLMLDKYNLGKLISSTRTVNGAMGQTMFVSSTEGDYVLKGNPLYSGQFAEEKYFIDNLHTRTKVNVPIPYMIDDSDEVFGWEYSLMPCLEGEHLNSESLQALLHTDAKMNIAEIIANTLAEFHSFKVNQFGELDTRTFEIIPFKGNYTTWLYNRIKFWLEDAKKYSVITDEDFIWVERLLDESEDAFNDCSPTFVMGDFKPGNFLIQAGAKGWEISGVFDFTNSYFGDPISDLIKMITIYLDNDERAIAKHLVTIYFNSSIEQRESLKKRIKIHMLHQRVLDWGCAKAMDSVTWDPELPFAHWAEAYTDAAAGLLD